MFNVIGCEQNLPQEKVILASNVRLRSEETGFVYSGSCCSCSRRVVDKYNIMSAMSLSSSLGMVCQYHK